MIGAIAGDIIGSRFEHGQAANYDFELFHHHCRFTDDTVCSLAVAKALMDGESFSACLRRFARRYPNSGYGGMFRQWFRKDDAPAYGSWGNGAPMRVSSVGWFARSLNEVDDLAESQSSATHDHPDAIDASKAVARAIFMLSHGQSCLEVGAQIEREFRYDLSEGAIGGRRWFDISAKGLAQTCAIKGGDTDTLACIAGSVSEAMHGVPKAIEQQAKERLDPFLLSIVEEFELAMTKRSRAHQAAETKQPADLQG